MAFRGVAFAIAALIFVLDRVTKVWIENHVSAFDLYEVIPGFFNIVHTKNRGAAFGMFSDSDSAVRTFLLVGVSVAVLIYVSVLLFRSGGFGSMGSRLTLIGLSLILGGALGNIYDRLAHGMVTDFLEFYHGEFRFAAFNVADSAITTGAALLLLDLWRTRKQADAPKAH